MHKFTIWIFLFFSASIAFGEQECKQMAMTTPTSQFDISGDGTLLDKKTNLQWQKCLVGQIFNEVTQNCDGSVTISNWQFALQFAENLNVSGGYAGYTDWRVPNIKELGSIVEYDCYSPAINLDVFPDDGGNKVWSSTSWNGTTKYNWIADFSEGEITTTWRHDGLAIRLVRDYD